MIRLTSSLLSFQRHHYDDTVKFFKLDIKINTVKIIKFFVLLNHLNSYKVTFLIIIYKNVGLRASDLEFYELRLFTIDDLIECLRVDHPRILSWIASRSSDWWEAFYRVLFHEAICIDFSEKVNKIKEARIFHIRGRGRVRFEANSLVFTCKDRSFESWYDCLQIVDFESNLEEKFIKEIMQVREMSAQDLIELILIKHLECNFPSPHHVWRDLRYIKAHYDVYLSFEERILLLPVTGTKKEIEVYLPTNEANVPSVFNYDLTCLPHFSTANKFIDFCSLKSLFGLNLQDIIDWETFFIRLGCPLPIIDINELKARVDFSDTSLPLFVPVEMFDAECARSAIRLFDELTNHFADFIQLFQYLPIRATHKTRDGVFPISGVFSSALFENRLPSVSVPEHVTAFAQQLGISVSLNFESCLKVLKTLVEDECVESSLYIEWFLKLRTHLSTNRSDLDLNSVRLIHLQNSDDPSKSDFYKLDDIYCCNDSPAIKLICTYLHKTLINYTLNDAFKPIETVLVELGCLTRPTLDDIISCLCLMAKDKRMFNQENALSCLTSSALQSFREMYTLLETSLTSQISVTSSRSKSSDMTLLERIEMAKSISECPWFKNNLDVLNKTSFPLITCDAHLRLRCDVKDDQLLVCFQLDFLNILRMNCPINKFYIDVNIARHCPYTMALLGVNYLDDILELELTHENNNIEEVNPMLDQIFQRALNRQDVKVFRVKFISISLVLNPKAFSSAVSLGSVVNEEDLASHDDEKKLIAYNEMKFAVFQNKSIYVKKMFSPNADAELALFNHVFRFALRTFYPEKSDEVIEQIARSNLAEIRYAIQKRNWMLWNDWMRESNRIRLSEMIFEMDDFNESALTEMYGSEETSNEPEVRKLLIWTNPDYKGDEENYDQVIIRSQLDSKPIKNIHQIRNFDNKRPHLEVDTEAQKRIGLKAEHFVSRYLKNEYGHAFNEYRDWVSSARKTVHPTASSGCNDALGYDFKINDYKHLFSSESCRTDKSVKMCYIEVKGTSSEWDGTFHISKNELEKCNRIDKDTESFIVIVVENVDSPHAIRFACVLDLTHEKIQTSRVSLKDAIIDLEPDS